jgi:hypothetical protein
MAMPDTNPAPGVTDAWYGLLLVHVPPTDALFNDTDPPTHNLGTPVITAGCTFTFIANVT